MFFVKVVFDRKQKKGQVFSYLTLLGLGLIKINDVSANFNNPRPSLSKLFGFGLFFSCFEWEF